MGFILLTISWALRTYDAILQKKGKGDVIGLFRAPIMVLLLMITWIALLLISLYLIYVDYGLYMTGGAIIAYFIVMPTIFGALYKQR